MLPIRPGWLIEAVCVLAVYLLAWGTLYFAMSL